MPTLPHYCHARQCQKKVPPRMLMCRKHWFMMDRQLQHEIWRHYREGQEIDKNPSKEYLKAMENAINFVADKEGIEY